MAEPQGMFAADLQALGLPAEAHARISTAIAQAVIGELATMDIAPRLRVDFSGPEGFGGSGGVAVAPLEI